MCERTPNLPPHISIVIGRKPNGERLRFERWLYEDYRAGRVTDAFLKDQMDACEVFY